MLADRTRSRLRLLGWTTAALLLGTASAFAAGRTSNAEITIPGNDVYPESMTGLADGTLINGSLGDGGIYRTAPDSHTAKLWIKPGTGGMMSVLGVLADPATDTLYACSSDFASMGVRIPGGHEPVALMKFNLKSGALEGSVALPGTHSFCNDIAIGPHGRVFVTDSFNPHVLELDPSGQKFTVWASDPRFTVKNGAGLDGITFGSDGNVYVDLYNGGKLFRIAVNKDGSAGKVTELETSRPITLPDALRKLGTNTLLMIEGAGRLDEVTIDGGNAKITTLKSGYDVPTSVWQLGATAWVLEGQLDHLFNKKNGKPHAFHIYPVPLKAAGGAG